MFPCLYEVLTLSLDVCVLNDLLDTELSQSVKARFSSIDANRGVFVTVLRAMDTEQIVDFMVKDVA